MSKPIVVTSVTDASSSGAISIATLAHRCRRGRPPHQYTVPFAGTVQHLEASGQQDDPRDLRMNDVAVCTGGWAAIPDDVVAVQIEPLAGSWHIVTCPDPAERGCGRPYP